MIFFERYTSFLGDQFMCTSQLPPLRRETHMRYGLPSRYDTILYLCSIYHPQSTNTESQKNADISYNKLEYGLYV